MRNFIRHSKPAQSNSRKALWLGKRAAFVLGLIVSLAAIGDSGSVAVSDGQVTITDTHNQTLNFPVSVAGDSSYDRYLNYSTADSGSAVAGTDYTAVTNGLLKLAAGATSANIPVTATGKSGSGTQPDKTFKLNLGGAIGVGPAPVFTVNQAISGTQGGSSVVSLDINGDGKPDLVSSNSAFKVVAMLNTSAPGATAPTYAAPQQISAIAFAQIAVGDADNDGKPDLLVYDSGNAKLVLLRNTTTAGSSTASFTAASTNLPAGTTVGTALGRPLLVDLDNDGRADAVMVNPNDNQIRAFRNTTTAGGAISFSAVETYSTGISARALIAADLNNDGKPDLAIGASTLLSTTAAQVFFNTGGGSGALFAAAQNVIPEAAKNHNADDLQSADFNHDGKIDLVFADRNGLPEVVLNTTPVGTSAFTYTAQAVGDTTLSSPDTLAVADFNGDGLMDFAITDHDGPANSKKGWHVFQNITAPGASSAAFVQLPGATLSLNNPGKLITTDFNTDGKPDLVVITSSSAAALDVLVNSTPAPTAAVGLAAGAKTSNLGSLINFTVADFNGDGRPDVAGVSRTDAVVRVLLNQTVAGTFTPSFTLASSPAVGNGPIRVVTSDFNGDGRPDLAVPNSDDQTVSVLLNTGTPGAMDATGAQFQATTLTGLTKAETPRAADFNGDGKPDLVVSDGNASGALNFLRNSTTAGSSSASFSAAGTIALTSVNEIAIADFDGDGRPDIAIASENNSDARVLLNTTTAGATSFTFAAAVSIPLANISIYNAVGDFDGDGKPDLAVSSPSGGKVTVLLNRSSVGNASFITGATITVTNGTQYIYVADFDGDGRDDFIVAAPGILNKASLFINQTTAGSDSASFVAGAIADVSGFVIAVGDFNNDGKPDTVGGAMQPFANTQYRSSLTATSATGAIHYSLSGSVSANPTTLNFNNVAVSQKSATQSVTLTNGSGTQVALTIPTSAGDFTVDNTPADHCGTTLNGGASCKVYLSFTPSTTGSRNTTLSINSGAVTITLNGSGVARAAAFTANPTSKDFGTFTSAGASATQLVTLINTGNVDVRLDSPVASGTGAAQYSIASGGTCVTNGTLAIAATCTYNVKFTMPSGVHAPTDYNATETWQVTDTVAPPSTQTATTTVTAHYSTGVASLTPATQDFGSIPVGNTSTDFTFTLKNTGDTTLGIGGTTASGGQVASEFAIASKSCGATLAAGASCDVLVRFAPTAAGGRGGTLSVLTADGAAVASLTGTGTAPVMSLDITSKDFGDVAVGQGGSQDFTVTNNGNANLVFSAHAAALVLSGAQASDYTLPSSSDFCAGQALAPGAQCKFTVQFTPPTTGTRTASLAVNPSNAATQNIPLTGNGKADCTLTLGQNVALGSYNASSNTQAQGTLNVTCNAGASYTLGLTAGNNASGSQRKMASGANRLNYSLYQNPVNKKAWDDSANQGEGIGSGTAEALTVFGELLSGQNVAPASNYTDTITATLRFGGNKTLTQTFTVTASASGALSFNPAGPIALGDQQTGTTGTAQTVTVTNSGNAIVTIGSTGVDDTANFEVSGCAAATALNPGQTCSLSLKASPDTAGTHNATVTINSDATPAASTLAISDNGVSPNLTLTGGSGAFGNVLVNPNPVPTQTFTLTNKGVGSITINSVGFSTAAGDFSIQTNGCTGGSATLAPNGACAVVVAFNPSATGVQNATLSVGSTAGTRTQGLSGTGVQPGLNLAPTTLAFGDVAVNGNKPLTETLTNTGSAPLHIGTIASSVGHYTVSNDLCSGQTIAINSGAGGNTCTFTVTYAPVSAGTENQSLSIPSDAAGTYTLALSGKGTQLGISLDQNALPFGNQLVGVASAKQTVTITNTGNTTLTISAVNKGGADAADYMVTNNCAVPVTAGNTCTIDVVFTPSSSGAKVGSLSIVSDAPTSPSAVTLSGTGTVAATAGAGGGGSGALDGRSVLILLALAGLGWGRRRTRHSVG